MARDLTRLLEPVEPQPEPGLEADDPRLAEIVALADQGKYGAAADAAEALVDEGVLDIRALSFLYYQAFIEGGIAALEQVFDVVRAALGPGFEAIGPARRRADHFSKRLAWLFDTIVDALEYHQKNATPAWEALQQGLDRGALEGVLRAGDRVAAELSADAYASAARALGRLLGALRARAEVLAAAPATSAAPAASPALATPASEQPSPAPWEDAPPAAPAAAAPPGDGAPAAAVFAGRARIELAVAPAFLELLAKLRAFETLIGKGELEKAAIVAEDVQQLIESFDPRAYFPEVFARFSALLSGHIGALSEHLEERGSLAWKARSQFYRVDLEGFVRG
ncbi:type VI secretion system protein IglI family protein [Sorangium sp. So ce291]|uniref:type VI secretion system protein IglI family protein n=1 Tax=Sorangium sp. So ce291 TaxID=3133294 RepID=UPI003F5F373C